jgi:hypothetical protein
LQNGENWAQKKDHCFVLLAPFHLFFWPACENLPHKIFRKQNTHAHTQHCQAPAFIIIIIIIAAQ